MTINLSNNIDRKNSYLQSNNSLNNKNENENIMNESDRKVNLNIKFAENCS